MRGNDVTMDAIKYLESRLPPGIRGNTLVDGDTLAIAIGEFDAAQKRADALAAANARLREALLDTQRLAWQLEHDGPRYYERKQSPYGEYLKCMYCGEISADAGEFRHTEKCPVRRLYEMKDARALLDVGA